MTVVKTSLLICTSSFSTIASRVCADSAEIYGGRMSWWSTRAWRRRTVSRCVLRAQAAPVHTLVVMAHTGQIDDLLHAGFVKDFTGADARPLQDGRRPERSSGQHHQAASQCGQDLGLGIGVETLVRKILDAVRHPASAEILLAVIQ